MIARRLLAAGLVVAALTSCGGSGGSATPATSAPTFCDAAKTAKSAADAQQALFSLDVSPSPTDVQTAIEIFSSKYAEMTALAPADIKADVETINKAAQQLHTALSDSAFDVVKMATTKEFAALTDTFASAGYKAALARFGAYTAKNCGITVTTSPPTSGT